MLRERKEDGIQCLTTVELLNTQTPSSSRVLELLQKWTQSVLSANRDFLLIYRLVTPLGMDVINFLSTIKKQFDVTLGGKLNSMGV